MQAQNIHVSSNVLRSPLTLSHAVEMFLDPGVALLTLFGAAWFLDDTIGAEHIVLALILLSLSFPGNFRLNESASVVMRKTLRDWILVTAMLMALGLVSGYIGAFSPGFVMGWPLATLVALLVAREAARQLVPRIVMQGVMPTAVVVGHNDVGAALAGKLKENRYLGVRFAGYFDDRTQNRAGTTEEKLLGGLNDIAAYVRTHRIDRIYIALPMASQPRILALLDQIKDTTASVFFVPDIFVTDLIQGRMESVEGIPVVAVCETPFTGINGLLKRGADIVLSSLILLMISPILAAVAIGVRTSSPGPIIFAQRRYGLDGRDIVVYKFRSMTVTEDGDKAYKQVTRGDARVTRFGQFIRKTSLDELPQFFNVLQGRMSIVGPRPHAVAVNEQYRRLIPGYMIRHKVKPGITGWAQVNGYRGGDDLEHMKKRIQFDLEYLRNWSLALDLKIILRTVGLVAKDSAAY